MRTKQLLICSFIVIVIIACKKESHVNTYSTLIKTKTTGTNVETYYYDSLNRISKIVYTSTANHSINYYKTFTFSNDTLYVYNSQEPIAIGCDPNPCPYSLTTAGLLYHNEVNPIDGRVCIHFETRNNYDSNGFLIRIFAGGIDGGNMDTLWNYNRNYTTLHSFSSGMGGSFDLYETYAYYSGRKNTIGNINFGLQHLGASSEELIKTLIVTLSDTASGYFGNDTVNYRYEFDTYRRVITKYPTYTNYDSYIGLYSDNYRNSTMPIVYTYY